MDTYAGSAPVVYSNGSGDDNWGGGGLWAILLLALCGRGGFGGCGNDGYDRGYSDADSGEINGRFNSIEDRISDLGAREDLRSNLKEICDTHMEVMSVECELGKQIQEVGFNQAIISKDAEIKALECCAA